MLGGYARTSETMFVRTPYRPILRLLVQISHSLKLVLCPRKQHVPRMENSQVYSWHCTQKIFHLPGICPGMWLTHQLRKWCFRWQWICFCLPVARSSAFAFVPKRPHPFVFALSRATVLVASLSGKSFITKDATSDTYCGPTRSRPNSNSRPPTRRTSSSYTPIRNSQHLQGMSRHGDTWSSSYHKRYLGR